MTTRLHTEGFFDPATWTVSCVAWNPATRRAAAIDPVQDYDFKSGHTSTVYVCHDDPPDAGAQLTRWQP